MHAPGMFVRMGTTVAVAGASGYAGGELLRLLAGAPRPRGRPGHRARQRGAAARRRAPAPGQPGRPGPGADRRRRRSPAPTSSSSRCRTAQSGRARRRSCRPTCRSSTSAPTTGWPTRRRLGGDLRRRARRHLALRAARAARPARGDRGGRRVAVTGCYAVAIILALAPLSPPAWSSPTTWSSSPRPAPPAPAASAKAHLLGSEVMGDLSPYKVGRHQHVPEILQATGARTAVVHAGAGADAARHPGHRHRPPGPRRA